MDPVKFIVQRAPHQLIALILLYSAWVLNCNNIINPSRWSHKSNGWDWTDWQWIVAHTCICWFLEQSGHTSSLHLHLLGSGTIKSHLLSSRHVACASGKEPRQGRRRVNIFSRFYTVQRLMTVANCIIRLYENIFMESTTPNIEQTNAEWPIHVGVANYCFPLKTIDRLIDLRGCSTRLLRAFFLLQPNEMLKTTTIPIFISRKPPLYNSWHKSPYQW